MNVHRFARVMPVLTLMLTGCFGGSKVSWSQVKTSLPPVRTPSACADENLLPPTACVRLQSPGRSTSPFVTGTPPKKKTSWTDSVTGWFHKTGDALKPKPKIVAPKDPTSLDNQPEEIGADLYLAIAQMAEQHGQWEKAEQAYKDALEKAPTDRLVLIGYARMRHRQERFDEAEEYYRRAIQAHPNDPVAYNDLSFCYARQKRFDEALQVSAMAVKLDPKSVLYRNNLARLLVAAGRPREAFEQLGQALAPADAYYNLGVLLYQNDDPAGALSCFEQAYKANPQHEGAYQMLVQAGRLQPPAPPTPSDAAQAGPPSEQAAHQGSVRVDVPPVETPDQITVQGRRSLPPSAPATPSGAVGIENQYRNERPANKVMVENPYAGQTSAGNPSRLPPVGSESFQSQQQQEYHLSDPNRDSSLPAYQPPAASVESRRPGTQPYSYPAEIQPPTGPGLNAPNENQPSPVTQPTTQPATQPAPNSANTSLRIPTMLRNYSTGPAQGPAPMPQYDPRTVAGPSSGQSAEYVARRPEETPTIRIPVGPRQPVDASTQSYPGYSAPLPGTVAPLDYSNDPSPRFLPSR